MSALPSPKTNVRAGSIRERFALTQSVKPAPYQHPTAELIEHPRYLDRTDYFGDYLELLVSIATIRISPHLWHN